VVETPGHTYGPAKNRVQRLCQSWNALLVRVLGMSIIEKCPKPDSRVYGFGHHTPQKAA